MLGDHGTRVGIVHTRFFFRLIHLFGRMPCFSRGISVSSCGCVPGGRFAHRRLLNGVTRRFLSTTGSLPSARSRVNHVAGGVTCTCTTGTGLCRTCRRSRGGRIVTISGRLLTRMTTLYSGMNTRKGTCSLLGSFRGLSRLRCRGKMRSIFTMRCSVSSRARNTKGVG